MQPLRWERRPDGLRAPALVCAFKGWNDAGEAATSAAAFMGASLDATRFATIDPEEFVDFQATRPQVKLVEGRTRQVEWPEWEVYEARIPRAPRDLVILTGDLGAGKTTMTQGIGEGLNVRGPITSPTFVISRVHPSLDEGPPLIHVDAYRLGDTAELDDLDLDTDTIDAVTVVEWGEGIAEALSGSRLELDLHRGDDDVRRLTLTPVGARWRELLI